MPEKYQRYEDVPWFRQSGINHVYAIAGLFFFAPLLWWVAILCLTGDIYTADLDEEGNLKTWGIFSKIFAFIIVFLQGLLIALAVGLTLFA